VDDLGFSVGAVRQDSKRETNVVLLVDPNEGHFIK